MHAKDCASKKPQRSMTTTAFNVICFGHDKKLSITRLGVFSRTQIMWCIIYAKNDS